MRNPLHLVPCLLLLAVSVQAQQPKIFDWVPANEESIQLDPMDFHAGRVFRPGSNGGNIHVIIHSQKPVTLAMTSASEWNEARAHPEVPRDFEYFCLREHVVDTTYECHLPPERAMVLLLHDERTAHHVLAQSIGVLLGQTPVKPFISPNAVHIAYHEWQCVQNCREPEYSWVRVVREKYQLSGTPKLYSVVTPGYDGQQAWMKIKSPTPVTIALLPSKLADDAFDRPEMLSSALSQTTCKQRGVQTMEFQCKLNRSEGPQSLILIPDEPARSHKKAEIEFQTLECRANCDLIPDTSSDPR